MVRAFLGLALLVARLAAAYPRTCATARTRGLSCADHNVTTRDGYVLETHTVWNARVASPARVVVLQHGLIDSSETWVANYGGESLARQLADDGWLVYLANSRGRPPYRHTTLGPDDAAFWAFSWDEMAALDLPATVDHALHVANATRASFVGHSQGTTLAMAGLAENATLADLVDVAVLLAPVAILDEGAFGNLTGLVGIADWLCARLPETCDMSIWDAVHAAAPVLCAWPLGYAACLEALCDVAGCKAKNNYNETVLVRDIFGHSYFAGTSWRNVDHFAQMERPDATALRRYDFGTAALNEAHYGCPTPPAYDLARFANRVAAFYGTGDRLVPEANARSTLALLSNAAFLEPATPVDGYGHGDFIWSLDAGTILFPQVAALLDRGVKS